MEQATLEHVNITVSDPDATAQQLSELFGWKVRWRGKAKNDGLSVHVGTDGDYLAVYSPRARPNAGPSSYGLKGGLNHVGIVVDDLDAIEARVIAAGLQPYGHDTYDPGRRFYFRDRDGIEFEVVSYAAS